MSGAKQIKDIVNRDIVNLTNCEHEPIHIPGSIQPHGFLLGLKLPGLVIDFCSGNLFDFIGLRHEQLLGRSFEESFGAEENDRFEKYCSFEVGAYVAPLQIRLPNKAFSCTVQKGSSILLAEFEPVPEENINVTDIYRQTRQFTAYMEKATTLQSLCQAVADETRAITGYDRVMIYRFDENYNGEVFAESRIESIEPFLGLHYPHTDIPVQARQLYIKNLLRLIADVNYLPVPIYTLDDGENKNLDLSLSVLRSVSPIHIKYLQNMGVGATLTISLIYEQRLWGLIACHHYSPKFISTHTRIAAQLQGHFLTSQIPVRQEAEEYVIAQKVNASLETLLSQVFSTEDLSLKEWVNEPELLKVCNASGVAILVEGKIYCQGVVPKEKELRDLVEWLKSNNYIAGLSTDKLSNLYPGARGCVDVSGVIYYPISNSQKDCIIWCRGEELQEVNWAGDPKKAIEKDENGLSPRKSFASWKEVKKCESLPWRRPELAAASNLANALQKHVHMVFLAREELKQRKLSEKLREANAELENINWIGTHDLKEPLRKIQMFASRILDEEQKGTTTMINQSVKRMNEAARRMQLLINDIMSYSRLSNLEEGFDLVDLNMVLQEVLNELEGEIHEKGAVIEYDILPVIAGVPFLLKQLFLNLVNNSLKFQKQDVVPRVDITVKDGTDLPFVSENTGGYYKIQVRDNGIGFENKHRESVFKIFRKLHTNEHYEGTGVGLALCKKIMASHNGFIQAESSVGHGATFFLYFPKQQEVVQ